MTTIAWKRNESISSDTLATSCGTKVLKKAIKIKELENGMIVGGAGSLIDVENFIKACEKAKTIDEIILDDDVILNAIVNIKDKAYLFEAKDEKGIKFVEINDDYASVGSGEPFALTAMHLGFTTDEAVNTSKEFDIYTGGDTITIKIK